MFLEFTYFIRICGLRYQIHVFYKSKSQAKQKAIASGVLFKSSQSEDHGPLTMIGSQQPALYETPVDGAFWG
jgi:hypothetical protein